MLAPEADAELDAEIAFFVAPGVDAVGGGRVWTGRQALENGLIDEFGGVDQAVRQARKLAEAHLAEIPRDATKVPGRSESDLAGAAIRSGLFVTQRDDYPVTVKTGHVLSELVLSPEEILYAGVPAPDVALVLFPEGLVGIWHRIIGRGPGGRPLWMTLGGRRNAIEIPLADCEGGCFVEAVAQGEPAEAAGGL